MTWTWKYFDADGAEIDPVERFDDQPTFNSQADAETWIGEQWQDLLDDGVESVSLFDGDTEIYASMSLKPAN